MFAQEENFAAVWEFFCQRRCGSLQIARIFRSYICDAHLNGLFSLLVKALVVLDEGTGLQTLET